MEAMDEDHPFELEVSIALSADVLQMPDLTENSLYRCKPAIMSGMPKSTDYCSLPRSALGPRSATMHSALPLLSSVRHATPGFTCTQITENSAQHACLLQTENTHKYLDAASHLPGYSVDRWVFKPPFMQVAFPCTTLSSYLQGSA